MGKATLHVIACEPAAAGVIPLLEQLLAEARENKISSLAVSTIDREGCAESRWSRASSVTTLIGGVALLQDTLIRALHDA